MLRAVRAHVPLATALASSVVLGLAFAAPAVALPVARFKVDRPTPRVNRVVTFDATASLCDVPPCSYSWRWYRPTTPTDFDRLGTTMGVGPIIQFAWTTTGPKNVVLTVTAANSTHGRGSATKQIVVRP